MDSVAWKNLIRASKAVMRLCDNGDTRKRRVFTESQELDLPSPTMDRLLPQPVMESIPSHLHPKVKSNVRQTVSATKKIFLNAFQQSAQQLLSLEEQGLSDKAQMDQLRLLWTKLWDKQLFTMQSELEERICNQNEQDESSARKAGSFDDSALRILEAAFARSNVLSQRECGMVANVAGITHQQVRTWFQNRRNRKRGPAYRESLARHVKPPSESTIPPNNRVISNLPKRAEAPQPPQPSSRPIRGLPKRRRGQPPEDGPSPTPSYASAGSASSVESIIPDGGFHNPLRSVDPSAMPTISFDGSSFYRDSASVFGGKSTIFSSSASTFDGSDVSSAIPFDLSSMITLPNMGNLDISNFGVGIPMDEKNPLFNMPMYSSGAFGEAIQQVVQDPTLTISPTFSEATTAVPSQSQPPVPDAPSKEKIDNMDDLDLFAMLQKWVNLPSSSPSSSISASAVSSGDSTPNESTEIDDESFEEMMGEMELASIRQSTERSQSPPSEMNDQSTSSSSDGELNTPIESSPGVLVNQAIVVETSDYPQLQSLYSPTSQMHTFPEKAMSQSNDAGWASGILPFDTWEETSENHLDLEVGGMMDGQGYTHPSRRLICVPEISLPVVSYQPVMSSA